MKIEKVHCLFEQSGTFKQAYKNLGYDAFDYDIQNNFGQTDYQIDLFTEIENGYNNKQSIFDNISKNDLIMAFFPCIYFESLSQCYFSFDSRNLKNLDKKDQYDVVIKRIENREKFLILLYKLSCIVETRGLRMILENPASQPQYLMFTQNFVKKPSFIDKNRALRGDYFKKATAYWYFNCDPTMGLSLNPNPKPLKIESLRGNTGGGYCSEERSMISPEYAKNFIADFVLGQKNENTQQTLF